MTSSLSDELSVGNISKLNEQIEGIFQILNQKEKLVIERRFAMVNGRRETLAQIGGSLNVTRERVRQIEKCAIGKIKRNVQNFAIFDVCEKAFAILKESGGVMLEDEMISKLVSKHVENVLGIMQLILSVDNRFELISNTFKFRPHIKAVDITAEIIEKVSMVTLDYLKKKGELEDTVKMISEIKKVVPETVKYQDIFFASVFSVCKDFKTVESKVGLITWRNINPRTLRDKIYFTLRKKTEPMHFVEISNMIMNEQFDKKSVNMQAVHNELIRYPEFVLIGRGLYALKEWGYSHGTVEDIIGVILKEKESLSEDEIISEVLKRRMVKPITIILNLKNKPQFVRTGRKQYTLKKD
jgi:hypothetical protein